MSARFCLCIFAACLAVVIAAHGQTATVSSPSTPAQTTVSDDVVGPGDVISIAIGDNPTSTVKYRASDAGYVWLPVLSMPIKVAGLTPSEISRSIASALKAAEQYRDPEVNVFVEEVHSRTVTVLGAVTKPSVYSLQKATTVLEVISMAGGLTPQAGGIVTIVRDPRTPESIGSSRDEGSLPHRVLTLDLNRLTKGVGNWSNPEVRPGDVINVSSAPIVYVVGAVTKPGGYALQEAGPGASVLQAIAMAEGLKPLSDPSRALIIRRSSNAHDQQDIPIDVSKMFSRKIEDHSLEPNDILFIPENAMKKSVHKMGEIAVQVATGVATYGLGYRLGTR